MQSVLPGFNRALGRALIGFIAAWPGVLRAQNQDQPGATVGTPATGEVLIEVETFGVGQVVRPGTLAGVRVALTDSATRPRAVAVHLAVNDADGDTVEYQRIVTLNPGREMGVWLYPRIPWLLRPGTVLTVVVRATNEGASGQLIAGRQIAAIRIRPQQVARDTENFIAVVGPGALMGLHQYELIASDKQNPPSHHEYSRIVSGLPLGLLPDAWEGWDAFSAVVWAGEDPGALSANQAQALIEWVYRGGHLVIVLRSVGSQWLVPNPLEGLLPRVDIERRTNVDLDRFRYLLSNDEALGSIERLPSGATIHTLTPASDATAAEASCVLSGVDGCIVARRLVGTGMVSVVGLDLRSSQLARVVQADRFWNRVLGRRGDVRDNGVRPSGGGGNAGLMSIGAARWVDDNIAAEISEVRVASVGVLLGLVVFIVYFLLAGPVGFAILKNRGWQQHSWVFFVAMTGLFTAITWTSVTALRPRDEHLWHFTLLQHVYGQPVQRARVFGSVLLPEYGQQEVQVGEAGVDASWRQNLTPWADPAAERSLPFPDARAYMASVRDATSLNVPARSTIKQFQIEWLGGPRWGMPVPPHPDRAPRLGGNVLISGQLVHDLPVALENVRIIVVEGQTSERQEIAPIPAKPIGRLRARGQALARTTPWEPGEVLDLGELFGSTASEPIAKVLGTVVPKAARFDQSTPKIKDWERDLLISLFPVVEQPDYTADRTNRDALAALSRRLTHRFDLGAWFTQPCVIIIGTLRNAPCPVPVSVDGRRLDGDAGKSSGRVLLQWVYPLRPRSANFTNPPRGKATP